MGPVECPSERDRGTGRVATPHRTRTGCRRHCTDAGSAKRHEPPSLGIILKSLPHPAPVLGTALAPQADGSTGALSGTRSTAVRCLQSLGSPCAVAWREWRGVAVLSSVEHRDLCRAPQLRRRPGALSRGAAATARLRLRRSIARCVLPRGALRRRLTCSHENISQGPRPTVRAPSPAFEEAPPLDGLVGGVSAWLSKCLRATAVGHWKTAR